MGYVFRTTQSNYFRHLARVQSFRTEERQMPPESLSRLNQMHRWANTAASKKVKGDKGGTFKNLIKITA